VAALAVGILNNDRAIYAVSRTLSVCEEPVASFASSEATITRKATAQLATIKKAMEILIISPDQLSSCSIAFFLRSVYDFHPKECEDA
jgi:hypothetical protein